MKPGIWPLLFIVALFVFPLGKSAGDYLNRKVSEARNAPLRALEAKNAAARGNH